MCPNILELKSRGKRKRGFYLITMDNEEETFLEQQLFVCGSRHRSTCVLLGSPTCEDGLWSVFPLGVFFSSCERVKQENSCKQSSKGRDNRDVEPQLPLSGRLGN